MKFKRTISGQAAREKALEGMRKVYQPVADTAGPRGRNVGWTNGWSAPVVTNDGNTIARRLVLEDPVENFGSELIRQAAEKTNSLAGDGTTTATILTYALASEGMREIRNGVNVVAVKNGMKKACAKAVEFLKASAETVSSPEEIASVAALSCQDAEAGKAIADAFAKVGKDGAVVVEEADGQKCLTVETTEGARWGAGAASTIFLQDGKSATLDDVVVLVTDKDVSTAHAAKQVLGLFSTAPGDKFLIVANSWSDEALKVVAFNWFRGNAKVLVVGAPGMGDRRREELLDLCALTGASLLSSEFGHSDFSKAKKEHLGKARSVTAYETATTLVSDKSVDSSARLAVVKEQLEKETDPYKREKIQERIGKMTGGVALIRVGASTATEAAERKLRVDDAVNATRAALEEGVTVGGGMAYVNAGLSVSMSGRSEYQGDEEIGMNIVVRALSWPMDQVAKNCGLSGGEVRAAVRMGDAETWDASAGAPVYDAMAAGIVDPLKVERLALEHAVSVASMFLMTEHIVYDAPDSVQPKEMTISQ